MWIFFFNLRFLSLLFLFSCFIIFNNMLLHSFIARKGFKGLTLYNTRKLHICGSNHHKIKDYRNKISINTVKIIKNIIKHYWISLIDNWLLCIVWRFFPQNLLKRGTWGTKKKLKRRKNIWLNNRMYVLFALTVIIFQKSSFTLVSSVSHNYKNSI